MFGFEVLHYRGQRLFTGGPDLTRMENNLKIK
jgi:hypothetical protein